jgi:HEPN domain-containing protein
MDNRLLAQEWQKIAEMDLLSAEHLLTMHPIPIEVICYHCQQSAEKNLKAYLVLHNQNPPKTHDLDELCKLCQKFSDTFKTIADICSDLTTYSVQPRYPMKFILEEQDMRKAMKNAKEIRDFILRLAPEMMAK